MKINTKITICILAAIALLASITLRSIAVSAWGDSTEGGKGRPSYSLQQIQEGVLGDNITFNSVTLADTDATWYKDEFNKNLPTDMLPHEKNFVGARKSGNNGKWDGNDIDVEDGEEYLIRIYVNNNNPNGKDAIAEDTKVAFSIPPTSGKQIQVNGFIESSNAVPNRYWDYVNFNSDENFHLEFLYGSALLKNNGIAQDNSVALGDEIVTQVTNGGVLIGYNALDGKIPGGIEYRCFITIRVRAVFDEFSVAKKVRVVGSEDKSWKDTVDAKIGDTVEFQIEYKNNSDKRQTNVAIKDTLPSNLRYVAGSTRLKNSTHPNGDKINEDYLVTDGLDIGNYGPGANALIRFYAEVVDDNLACGGNNLVNWVQAGVGDTTIQDFAQVQVNNDTRFYMILTALLAGIAVCLIIIFFLIFRIIKRYRLK